MFPWEEVKTVGQNMLNEKLVSVSFVIAAFTRKFKMLSKKKDIPIPDSQITPGVFCEEVSDLLYAVISVEGEILHAFQKMEITNTGFSSYCMVVSQNDEISSAGFSYVPTSKYAGFSRWQFQYAGFPKEKCGFFRMRKYQMLASQNDEITNSGFLNEGLPICWKHLMLVAEELPYTGFSELVWKLKLIFENKVTLYSVSSEQRNTNHDFEE
ncbi:hypothetical protein ACLOJK_035431 [Asimina triloba]